MSTQNGSIAARTQGRKIAATDPVVAPPALLGESAAVRQSRAVLERAAVSPLLLLADEGLDAAAVARYVHDCSRAGQPFVRIDCARSDRQALDVELFGTRARAATELETLGSRAALLAARRGTLFLDQVGELPAALQRRLARVLRDGEARVAGRERVHLDARVIATAMPSIVADAADRRFRPDLLRRFGPSPVTIPPLRERAGDLPAIVARVAADVAAGSGREAPRFTPAALTMLAALPWTRNVEELRGMLVRALDRVDTGLLRQEDLLPSVALDGLVRRLPPAVSLREARRQFEREYIAAVLQQHGWRMSEAARTLGIERANLYRKTRELGIQRSAPGGRGHS
jgi:two-component system response regulator GlrR